MMFYFEYHHLTPHSPWAISMDVGTDTETWKAVIGRHGVRSLNENERYLLQLFCCNGLRNMNIFFSANRCL